MKKRRTAKKLSLKKLTLRELDTPKVTGGYDWAGDVSLGNTRCSVTHDATTNDPDGASRCLETF